MIQSTKNETKTDRAKALLGRIRDSVGFWREIHGNAPDVVRLSLHSFYAVLPLLRESGEWIPDANGGRVLGVPIEFDPTIADGSYRIN